MFDSFISILIGAGAVFALVVFFIFVRPALNRKKAAMIAAENQRRQHEEGKKLLAQMENERRESERQAQISRDLKASEIDAAISAAPGSEKYRLSTMQTEVTAHTLNITEFTPISKKRYIAFDLETTGLNHTSDMIVEIGAVLVENGVITDEYHQLVNPGRPIPYEASAVNHITDDMVAGQPQIHQVLPSFLAFVGDDILAAHNAAFDIRFLSQACMRNRFRIPAGFFDTMNFTRYWPEAEDKKLVSLLAAAGIECENAHRALDDSRALAAFITATNERRSKSKKH